MNILLNIFCWQDILEKFEFFPIKCLIQRATDIYRTVLQKNEQMKDMRPFKTKVGSMFVSLHDDLNFFSKFKNPVFVSSHKIVRVMFDEFF